MLDWFPPETRTLAWDTFVDKSKKMSSRLICLAVYGVFRTCDFVDWLFPVKVIKASEKKPTTELSSST